MYQWLKGGSNIGTGANSATYTIVAVAESDEGEYRCVVSNAANTVSSTAASLTVCKCAWVSYDFNPKCTGEVHHFNTCLRVPWWLIAITAESAKAETLKVLCCMVHAVFESDEHFGNGHCFTVVV